MNRTIIIIGIIIVIIGLAWPILGKLPIGRLPGDIIIKKEDFSFYFPITTMILVSIIITALFYLFKK